MDTPEHDLARLEEALDALTRPEDMAAFTEEELRQRLVRVDQLVQAATSKRILYVQQASTLGMSKWTIANLISSSPSAVRLWVQRGASHPAAAEWRRTSESKREI